MASYTAILDGQGETSWGSGRRLVAYQPVSELQVNADGVAYWKSGRNVLRKRGTPFEVFEQFCHEHLSDKPDGRHVIAAIAYEAGREANFLPGPSPDMRWPLLLAAAYEPPHVIEESSQRADDGVACIPDLGGALWPRIRGQTKGSTGTPLLPKWTATPYRSAVRRVLQYIAAGDVYQVNLAYPWRSQGHIPALHLFHWMQRHNPVPYGAYFRCGGLELVVNSPECLLRRRGRLVETFPIKGTRPRGRDLEEDKALRSELLADSKEKAELVMIVDLERNDLGKLCVPGSVEVVEHARLHTFAHWHHLQSWIRGWLRPGVGWDALLRGIFPGGSVTGAPKRRAMEIIDEIEAEPRGFYTGALGWLRSREEGDFGLMIRTAVIDSIGLEYWTGGGIVADSVPDREYAETCVKVSALLQALEKFAPR